jgi:ATP-dependent Clp protease protease subunit
VTDPSARHVLPEFTERTGTGHRTLDPYSKLLSERIVFLGTPIDATSANDVTAQFMYLEHQAPEQDISLYINSPGGSVSAGLAIFDTMNFIKPDVSTLCTGLAASMGAFLLAAGAKGKRFSLPNSRVMIHQPSGGSQGMASDIEIQAREILYLRERLARIMADNTGQTIEQIHKDTDRDRFMSGDEAVEYGLIDKVLTNRA